MKKLRKIISNVLDIILAFVLLCHYGEKSAYALFRTPLFLQRYFPGERRHHDVPEAYFGNIKQRDLDFPAVP